MLTPQERYFPRERVIREVKITCLLLVCLGSLLAFCILGAQLWT